ncbi:MAG: hypothetical protein GF416_02225 [Candidatus Altiarchaeales archaeon]|nr:hypothetical protein [Candidatus Altiarchaeales archaeon]MBD3415935.1 hypothetical protein [Candidatus Altiarchaeales archaeon]
MVDCESCGMPMEKLGDFGGGKMENRFCVHCCDGEGNLKSREEVRSGMARFMMSPEGETMLGRKIESIEEAEKLAEAHMSNMPAWKD